MTTPKWKPGTLYAPGSLVVPRTKAPDTIVQPSNPDFETGDLTGWTTGEPSRWAVLTGGAFTGTHFVQATGSGLTSLASTTFAPIEPGQRASVKAMGKITNHGTDDAGFQAVLEWWDDSAMLSYVTAPQVNGKGGYWVTSGASGIAPAGATRFRISLSVSNGTHGSTVEWDSASYDYAIQKIPDGLVYEATQAEAGRSATSEPDWPGNTTTPVTDNEVTWQGKIASRVVWKASPICKSGGTEPTWPTDVDGQVGDGTMAWKAISRRVTDAKCPNSKVVAIMASKVFAADKDIVRFSATANPLDWSSADDAGYLPTGLQQANSNDMAVLAPYRSNLTTFNASSFQNWQVDPDPAAMSQLDQMEGIGSTYQQAAQPVGNDLLYLSQLGVRSVSMAAAADSLQAGDVGLPVDGLVQVAMRVARLNADRVLATYYPSAGQYWLAFKDADPLVVSGAMGDGAVGRAANFQYAISGGVGTRTATISAGALPTGLSMDSSGHVTGTRSATGSFSWTVHVVDQDGVVTTHPDSATIVAAVTWDPAKKSQYLTLSNGNLTTTNTLTGSAGDCSIGATLGRDAATANHYFEVYYGRATGNRADDFVGIALTGSSVFLGGTAPGRTANSRGIRGFDGFKFVSNSGVAYGSSFTTGNTIGCLVKNGKLYFSKNGVWVGDPAAETGAAFTGLTGTFFPAASSQYGADPSGPDVFTGRFNSADFAYPPPTGAIAWEGV